MRLIDYPAAPCGHFRLWAYRDGVLVDREDVPNLIVNTSKPVLAGCLGGAAPKAMTQIGYGSVGGGPAVTDTALSAPVFYKPFDLVSYPASNQVQFTFSLQPSEGNGLQIMEFGLVSTDGTLFARRVRTVPLAKDSDLSISGTWTISF